MNKKNSTKPFQQRADTIVERATALAATTGSWMAFSNTVFAGDGSLVSDAFPRMTERRAFYESPQYDRLNEIMLGLIKRFGVDDGTATKKSGKFVVRLPKTLHAALEIEASQEGVSLNQLAVSKLGVRLKDSTDISTAMVVEAFKKVYDGWSSDRVIVEPDLNGRYLQQCRALGLTQSDFELNHILYKIRKNGGGILPPATKRPKIKNYDGFLFASEIAFRYLQRREEIALDRVLCDPELRERFDEIAGRLAPEYSPFELRMGALYLRKTHRLTPGVADGPLYDLIPAGRVCDVKLSDVPDFPGAYVFYENVRPIYAGETAKLRSRIGLHLQHSGQMFLPSWLELGFEPDLELRFFAFPGFSPRDRVRWLNQFINRERPALNYQVAA